MSRLEMIVIGIILAVVVLHLCCNMFGLNRFNLRNIVGGKKVEKFTPAPIDYEMGTLGYDGVKLETPQTKYTLNDSGPVYVPEGTPLPLCPSFSIYGEGSNGTYVDGTNDSVKAMSMFTFNNSSPDCCPASYSTSTGCVCMTNNQKDFLISRGNNRSAPTNF